MVQPTVPVAGFYSTVAQTGCMVERLSDLTEDIAEVIPDVDSRTSGQYGDGIGSENEERQIELLLDELREQDSRYQEVRREVPYPESAERCDLILPDGTPVEAKLVRYWRANGDPEPNMHKHVFSPFHKNTLLTDAHSLTDSEIGDRGGLLGLFYIRHAFCVTTLSTVSRTLAGESTIRALTSLNMLG